MSIIKKTTILLLLLQAALLITACKNVPPVTSGIGSEQIAQGERYKQHLQVHNKELSNQLHISGIRSRTTNDLLEINLNLTSTYEKSLQLQYQFQWFDQQGFAIEAEKNPWQPLELHGMQTSTLSGLAPTTQVTTFSLYIRKVPERFFKF